MKNQAACYSLVLLVTAGVAYAASLSRADREFMNTAARMDMIGAHEGQVAESQASRADTKDIAKSLVQDHSQSYDQIAALAAKSDISIPKGIDTAKIPSIRRLRSLKGARFDRQFAMDESAAQRQALIVFKREAEHGENADVKAYATNQIPTLEKDLKRIEPYAKSTRP